MDLYSKAPWWKAFEYAASLVLHCFLQLLCMTISFRFYYYYLFAFLILNFADCAKYSFSALSVIKTYLTANN